MRIGFTIEIEIEVEPAPAPKLGVPPPDLGGVPVQPGGPANRDRDWRVQMTPVRRGVLVVGRQMATERSASGVRKAPVSEVHHYAGFTRRIAAVLSAGAQIRRHEAGPGVFGKADTPLILCPWPVAVRWFDHAKTSADASRCVVIDGDEEWLVERGGRWRMAAAIDSAALSRWKHDGLFAYPVVVGRVDVADRIGATLPPPQRWIDGYTSFTHRDATDVVDLLVRYLGALGYAGA